MLINASVFRPNEEIFCLRIFCAFVCAFYPFPAERGLNETSRVSPLLDEKGENKKGGQKVKVCAALSLSLLCFLLPQERTARKGNCR